MKVCANICPFGKGECNGPADAMVFGWSGGGRVARVAASAAQAQDHPHPLQFLAVLRAAHPKLDQAPPPPLSNSVCVAYAVDPAHRAGLRSSVCSPEAAVVDPVRR